ncbi:hypothetical protein CRM22_002222 [Opisthorchis felineus]|uniref:Uncharacterized protein n=1 Tax=Opisthorchis felineus TaxID=147828 RepID=A0A4S2M718_OPIFE|nr:hypothetical protein CRM22_002222 [Opisthorchis felineus]
MMLTSMLHSFFCVYLMLQMISANVSAENTSVINGTNGKSVINEKSTSLTTLKVSDTTENGPTAKRVSAENSTEDTTTKEARGKSVEDAVVLESLASDSDAKTKPLKASNETASVNSTVTNDISTTDASESTTNTGVWINASYGYELISGSGIVLLTSILLRRLPLT